MFDEKNQVLKCIKYLKSIKVPFIIHEDPESLIKKIIRCKDNAEKLSTTKVGEHTPCGNSMLMVSIFDDEKNYHDKYRGVDSMKKFCEHLQGHAMKRISYINKSHFNKTNCYICQKEFGNDIGLNQHRVRDPCHYTGKYRGATHSIWNLIYKTPRGIVLVFHNSSYYEYKFIMKELANEFKGLQCCCARDLFRSQIPATTEGFELQISCTRSSYLTH